MLFSSLLCDYFMWILVKVHLDKQIFTKTNQIEAAFGPEIRIAFGFSHVWGLNQILLTFTSKILAYIDRQKRFRKMSQISKRREAISSRVVWSFVLKSCPENTNISRVFNIAKSVYSSAAW